MDESGVIRIYNRSDERVTKVIRGTRISIPAHGGATVSARKGREMLQCYPGQLTEDSAAAFLVDAYTEEEMAMVDGLNEEELRKCLRVVMSGHKANIKQALEASQAKKLEFNKNS